MSTHRIFTGTVDEIECLDHVLENLLCSEAHQYDERSRLRIRLGFHELLVNILRHAYGACLGTIDVEFDVGAEKVSIGVSDRGRPYPGTLDVDLPSAPATSGYGLPIIGAVFDQVAYERVDNRNQWTLIVRGGQRR